MRSRMPPFLDRAFHPFPCDSWTQSAWHEITPSPPDRARPPASSSMQGAPLDGDRPGRRRVGHRLAILPPPADLARDAWVSKRPIAPHGGGCPIRTASAQWPRRDPRRSGPPRCRRPVTTVACYVRYRMYGHAVLFPARHWHPTGSLWYLPGGHTGGGGASRGGRSALSNPCQNPLSHPHGGASLAKRAVAGVGEAVGANWVCTGLSPTPAARQDYRLSQRALLLPESAR
jgi:hypothetical protein